MKKLNIYISRQIFVGFLLVTFSLMSILWLTQSLRFVELVTNKGLPLSLFIKMTSCLMPRLFSLLSPISVFVAVQFVYNRMLSDRELVVMQSAGISPWQNARPAIYFGLAMSVFGLYVNNFAILEQRNGDLLSHLVVRRAVHAELPQPAPGRNILLLEVTLHRLVDL